MMAVERILEGEDVTAVMTSYGLPLRSMPKARSGLPLIKAD